MNPKLNNITDVFFDLDHTLWDFEKNSALTFEKIFKMNDLVVDLSEFLKVYQPINTGYWQQYRNGEVDRPTLRYRRLKDSFDTLEMEVKARIIYKLSDDYVEHLSTFNYLFDNALETLDYLQEKYRLHIITNGFDVVQDAKLKNANIHHYFKTVTNSEMVGAKKPHPKIFKHAMTMAKSKPQNSIMVGDNLEADIEGAQNIGMETVFCRFSDDKKEHNGRTISDLKALRLFL